ncbi:MAG: helix-turn-helix domain-containing protein [Candidatus Sericytochromatia bacterium]
MIYKIIPHLKLRWTDRHVSNLAFLSASGRVAKTIVDLADKENNIINGEYIVNHKMTRQDFANIAGTSRETLTRIIMEFQDENILKSIKNQIIVYNKKALVEKII